MNISSSVRAVSRNAVLNVFPIMFVDLDLLDVTRCRAMQFRSVSKDLSQRGIQVPRYIRIIELAVNCPQNPGRRQRGNPMPFALRASGRAQESGQARTWLFRTRPARFGLGGARLQVGRV